GAARLPHAAGAAPSGARSRIASARTIAASLARRRGARVVEMARRPRGRILAIKWGMNPNSSSLGVDVTFLLVGATALAVVTPVIGALLRWRANKPSASEPGMGGKTAE